MRYVYRAPGTNLTASKMQYVLFPGSDYQLPHLLCRSSPALVSCLLPLLLISDGQVCMSQFHRQAYSYTHSPHL